MSANRLKFGISIGLVIVAVGWLGFTGFQEGKSYYVTLDEMYELGDKAHGTRLRVAGDVKEISIKKSESGVSFMLNQESLILKVNYTGIDPLPNTFKDGAQAVIEGVYEGDNKFTADFVQAKCTSKYEAEYNE